MILDIDVGNSRIKWQICSAKNISKLYTSSINDLAAFDRYILESEINKIRAVSSTKLGKKILQHIINITQCSNITEAQTFKQQLGVTNGYDDWQQLGVDRWLAMLAAYNINKKACYIIDCGTAITIDYINNMGLHMGGYILPSLLLIHNSLTPYITLNKDAQTAIFNGLGKNTDATVYNGALTMLVSFLKQQIIQTDVTVNKKAHIYITGGGAQHVKTHLSQDGVICKENLVLDGLRLALA